MFVLNSSGPTSGMPMGGRKARVVASTGGWDCNPSPLGEVRRGLKPNQVPTIQKRALEVCAPSPKGEGTKRNTAILAVGGIGF